MSKSKRFDKSIKEEDCEIKKLSKVKEEGNYPAKDTNTSLMKVSKEQKKEQNKKDESVTYNCKECSYVTN